MHTQRVDVQSLTDVDSSKVLNWIKLFLFKHFNILRLPVLLMRSKFSHSVIAPTTRYTY